MRHRQDVNLIIMGFLTLGFFSFGSTTSTSSGLPVNIITATSRGPKCSMPKVMPSTDVMWTTAIAMVGNFIYSFGGAGTQSRAEVYRYDLTTDEWVTLASMNQMRESAKAVALSEDEIFVVGKYCMMHIMNRKPVET